MADEAPAAAPENERITVLNDNDVLLGRGRGSSKFIGNARFLALVETRKDEYNATNSYTSKGAIGREIFLEITQKRKGRFLQPADITPGARNVVEEGTWCVASVKAAEEKCKQALREKRELPVCLAEMEENEQVGELPLENHVGDANEPGNGIYGGGRFSESSDRWGGREADRVYLNGGSIGPFYSEPTYQRNPRVHLGFGAGSTAATSDATLPLQLHHGAYIPFINTRPHSPSQTLVQPNLVMNASVARLNSMNLGIHADLVYRHQSLFQSSQDGLPDHFRHFRENANRMGSVQVPSVADYIATVNPASNVPTAALQETTTKAAVKHHSVALQENGQIQDAEIETMIGLAALSLADLPKFTEEQEAIERANMTDEEKASALSDLFGVHCANDSPKPKRAKRDLDSESIEFLVRQMKVELSKIPYARKQAFVEALAKCRPSEFCDRRLEQFLRCEGMNTKLGAERFVNYWESRRKVFGAKKYLMRMTLDEALKDDLAAIEDGLLCVLPYHDVSGRQILFMDPSRRSAKQYSSESLLRAFWYTIEVASQENNDRNSGFVCLNWFKNSTIFEYDRKAYDPCFYFEAMCWPVQCIAGHTFCWSSIFIKFLKPVLRSLMDKRSRSRTISHTVPESEILQVLSEFGITKDILPTEMGGTVSLSQSQWMANRRAVEMEEL